MKIGINWNERETKLSAGIIAAAFLSILMPDKAETIQSTTMWMVGAFGVLTTTAK